MRIMKIFLALISALFVYNTAQAQDSSLSFFITSKGSGEGANLGGLNGADMICKSLATAAGQGDKNWKAYLSTNGEGGVNAKDRIGDGPWYNAKGVMVAMNVADLHSDNNKLSKENSLTEMGMMVNGRGDSPNMHDIITGSNLDGTASEMTCNNWTSSAEEGGANAGHHDRSGGGANPTSWNFAHPSRGCSQPNLIATGGNGYFYCFAAN
ncbi:MAG: hypothetical protein JKY84_06150 [Emcibacteraceae bacterium]|nr:hypothetical protein [Emcibacteraceae bacterium]